MPFNNGDAEDLSRLLDELVDLGIRTTNEYGDADSEAATAAYEAKRVEIFEFVRETVRVCEASVTAEGA